MEHLAANLDLPVGNVLVVAQLPRAPDETGVTIRSGTPELENGCNIRVARGWFNAL